MLHGGTGGVLLWLAVRRDRGRGCRGCRGLASASHHVLVHIVIIHGGFVGYRTTASSTGRGAANPELVLLLLSYAATAGLVLLLPTSTQEGQVVRLEALLISATPAAGKDTLHRVVPRYSAVSLC